MIDPLEAALAAIGQRPVIVEGGPVVDASGLALNSVELEDALRAQFGLAPVAAATEEVSGGGLATAGELAARVIEEERHG